MANETSQPSSSCSRCRGTTRGRSERRSRISCARAIRDGALRDGAQVPSTRDLARQLGVSRRVIVDAYGQLAAEGYLSLRQGARPRVSANARRGTRRPALGDAPQPAAPALRLPARGARPLGVPARLVAALAARGARGHDRRRARLRRPARRRAAARRARGVPRARARRRRRPERIVVTHGYSQALALVCCALRRGGRAARRDGGSEQRRRSVDRRARRARGRARRHRRARHPRRRAAPRRARRGDRHAGAPAAERRRAEQRAPLRPARVAARAPGARDRGRLRRRVPLRPRRGRRAAGPRARRMSSTPARRARRSRRRCGSAGSCCPSRCSTP